MTLTEKVIPHSGIDSGVVSKKAVLITKTAGYRHSSIPALVTALQKIPTIEITHLEDDLTSLPEILPQHQLLILAQTTGLYLTETELAAIETWVTHKNSDHGQTGSRQSRGVIGIHAATSGMKHSQWYGELLGASFVHHPVPQWGNVKVHNHIPSTSALPDPSPDRFTHDGVPPLPEGFSEAITSTDGVTEFAWYDEWYNYRLSHPVTPPSDARLLVTVDTNSYSGAEPTVKGQETGEQPLAWCHEFGNVRVFYTALGHFDEAYEDPWFMGMLEGALEWVTTADVQEK